MPRLRQDMNEKAQQLDPETAQDETLCSEAEFARTVADRIPVLVHIDELAKKNLKARFSRRIYATILEESSDLENLLDAADARYNTTFAGLFELVSSLRAISAAGYALKNVQQRTRRDDFLSAALEREFRGETEATQRFTDSTVRDLLDRLHDEVVLICGPAIGHDAPAQILNQERVELKRLPHTLGSDDHADVETMVAAKAALFLAVHKTMFDRAEGGRFQDVAEMRLFVREVCNEEQARFLEAKLTNIRSRYDTFIRNTSTERDSADLRDFRYVLEISFQLMRCVRHLVHFYERHENDIRDEEIKSDVARLVDKAVVLDRTLNFALFFVYRFVEAGAPIAERLLHHFTTAEVAELELPEGCMLHARPASLIAKVVIHHGTPVEMTMGGETCYAGSIMKVILLAGNHLKESRVTFKGDRLPVADLRLLFEHRLGEDGLEKLPEQLSYLCR
ncbi:MAG: hypothetical protein H6807_13695 [Planctomycetes bacterium]|nr:hypothetical protein [Planctomycetota bacterium]